MKIISTIFNTTLGKPLYLMAQNDLEMIGLDDNARLVRLFADGEPIGAGTLSYDQETNTHKGTLNTWTEEAQAYIESNPAIENPTLVLEIGKVLQDGNISMDYAINTRCKISHMITTPEPTEQTQYLTAEMFEGITKTLEKTDTLASCKVVINDLISKLKGGN